MENMNIVFVGHVDHGKSTLIGRLLYDTNSLPPDKIEEVKKTCEALGKEMEFGFILDHLQEEREQGITIDTCQIFFKTPKRNYVIIDAPGHVEFIKNMITGASQAEAAILIIDANEGVKEQTKRHAYILGMLGLKQIIVLINKMDLVDYKEERFNEVKQDIALFFEKLSLKPSYTIPVAAKYGDNIAKESKKMAWYKGKTFLSCLDTFKIKEKSSDKALRFPIQDAYKIDDKRIFAGRIESGTIRQGDEITILPQNTKTKVKSVEKFLEKPTMAEAGESIGITTEDQLFIERGNVISHPDNLPKVTDRIKANVFWMSKKDFNINEIITLKSATQEVSAKIEKIEKKINSSTLEEIKEDIDTLRNNEVGTMIIKTLSPVVVDDFNYVPELGRFVFEKNMITCAGGIITHTKER
ncbi:MAG: GTP-binding protein [Nanoarchaeota archaeon]|nr:GTP-binding protein [Nanoarchaeota archaeon]